MNKLGAEIGAWYSVPESGVLFEVVAIDDSDQTIEAQYVDGEIGEFELESWRELKLEPAQPPEDWRLAYEVSEEEYPDPSDAIVPEQPADVLIALKSSQPDYIAEEEELLEVEAAASQ